jgi:hypothetical protein
MSSILDKFNLDDSLFEAIADNIDSLQSTSTTKRLVVGKTITVPGSINGAEVMSEITLHSAGLSRLSFIKQKSPNTGQWYNLVTGVMNPVKMDIVLNIEGEKMHITELLYQMVLRKNPNVNREKFQQSLVSMGMNFNNSMPLFFQQFGANEEGFSHALNAFKMAGAVDVISTISNTDRPTRKIESAYSHKTGVPITSFEIGTVNRDMSSTKQGFLNLVDASIETFQRVYRLRLDAHELGQKTAGLSQAEVVKVNAKREELIKLSRQWVSNWSGSQQRMVKDAKSNKVTPVAMYDPVNAPCGRFSLVINGSEVECDLWSNSARANTSGVNPLEPTSFDNQIDNDEVPF